MSATVVPVNPLRFATLVAALFVAGCNSGETDSVDPNLLDGGADGAAVILDGGGTPATPPDGPSLCPQGAACNYQTGEGCSGATPACVPLPDGNGDPQASCEAAGTGKSGDVCTQWTDCAAGYICAEKECHKLCCGGDWTGCPSDAEHCILALKIGSSQATAKDTGAMLCFEVGTCDPLAPASCTKPGTTCQIVDPTGASACFPEGTGAAGDPCPCKGGFLCADEGDKAVCRQLCKAVEGGGAPYCPAGQTCIHYAKHPAGVGECVE